MYAPPKDHNGTVLQKAAYSLYQVGQKINTIQVGTGTEKNTKQELILHCDHITEAK